MGGGKRTLAASCDKIVGSLGAIKLPRKFLTTPCDRYNPLNAGAVARVIVKSRKGLQRDDEFFKMLRDLF